MNTNEHNEDVQFVPETDSDARRETSNLDDSVIAEENLAETVKKLRAELKKAQEEKLAHLTDLQKAKADFINMRKRDEEAQKEFTKYANEGIISDLISTLDNFTMAFSNKEAWEKVDKNWRTGVEYIFSNLVKTLENYGLKEVNPLGEKFDPVRDEAVSYEAVTDAQKDNCVISVIQKGYSLNGKQLKAPKVIVGEYK